MKGFIPVLLLVSFAVRAQDLPVFNEYFLNYEILNPAFTGMQNCYSAGIMDHHQWLGMEGAPNTQIAFGSGRFAKARSASYHGLGILLNRDQNGAYHRMNAGFQYSYHVLLSRAGKTHLSLGMSAAVNQEVLNEGEFYNYNNDPVINGSRLSAWNPDLTVGLGIYNDRFTGGLTAAGLLPSMNYVSDPVDADRNQRTYIAFAGLSFPFAKRDLELEPSVLFLLEERSFAKIDANIRVFLKNKYWLGVSIRKYIGQNSNGALMLIPAAGIVFERIEVAYSYGTDFSYLQKSNYGSHSLMVRWRLCKESKGALPCPAYQ